MPRSLVLGNGNILICYDRYGQVRDFYFPYVGQENHTANCVHRVGLWSDGKFEWMSDSSWSIDIDYEKHSLAAHITAKNDKLGLTVSFRDVVYNEDNIFLRNVSITNNTEKKKEVKIFFGQQFQISGIQHGNTAYYDPDLHTLIHYRGKRVFLIGGKKGEGSFDDYSIGLFNLNGRVGTWKDAENGSLSKNSVEHGSVDSVIAFTNNIGAGKSISLDYWVVAAIDIPQAKNLHESVIKKSPSHIKTTTTSYWHAWVNKLDINFGTFDKDVAELFKKSLLIIRTHVDNNGAIIASGDSAILQHGFDTYSYMWPRDAAITVLALDRTGYPEVSSPFFRYCNEILTDDGYLLHKYRADKSLGSSWHPWVYKGKKQLAIQEDESAIVLYALWWHYQSDKNLEFIEKIYNSFVHNIADFLYEYRDKKTKLPHGSYDLWEEKYGTSTYTSATVYAGLVAASNFARVLGKRGDMQKYYTGAKEVQEGIVKYLYNNNRNFFYKLIDSRDGTKYDETIDISSVYGPFRFGVLSPFDAHITEALNTLHSTLCCNVQIGKVGGAVRYEYDNYQLKRPNTIGNPWFITTLWLYQFDIARARTQKDLEKIKESLTWICKHALKSGILSEQLDPETGEQISVAPLIWSHAEFLHTIMDYLDKERALKSIVTKPNKKDRL